MSNELLPCPFCGGEAKPLKNYRMSGVCVGCEHSIENPRPPIQCLCCGGVMMGSAEHWDRRFVCLDKNGDKVFAGDNIRLTAKEIGKDDDPFESVITLEPCISQDGVDMSLRYTETEATEAGIIMEIELIKEGE